MKNVMPFTVNEWEEAYRLWHFNCGPGALCAILEEKPRDMLALMPWFLGKGYTNIRDLFSTLTLAGVKYSQVFRSIDESKLPLPRMK